MTKLFVGFKKLSETAKLPKAPEHGNVGWDIFSDQDISLVPGTTKKISTNIQLASFEQRGGSEIDHLPFMKIEGRSGMASKGVFPVGGIIDPNYRGEIGVVLTYNNRFGDNYDIKKGDRIAQLVFYDTYASVDFSLVEEIQETNRGSSGFGSSGR